MDIAGPFRIVPQAISEAREGCAFAHPNRRGRHLSGYITALESPGISENGIAKGFKIGDNKARHTIDPFPSRKDFLVVCRCFFRSSKGYCPKERVWLNLLAPSHDSRGMGAFSRRPPYVLGGTAFSVTRVISGRQLNLTGGKTIPRPRFV